MREPFRSLLPYTSVSPLAYRTDDGAYSNLQGESSSVRRRGSPCPACTSSQPSCSFKRALEGSGRVKRRKVQRGAGVRLYVREHGSNHLERFAAAQCMCATTA